ncbi:alcohol dehydrogenase GroES domain protein [Meredithblackwellia eburnea MCA 4105]
MSTMKAAMFYGAHDLRVEDVPNPKIKPDQVKVKIAWCGICGSDLHEYEAGPILCPSTETPHGITGETLPIPLGHEFSGTITEVGPQAQGGWKVGDRVVVEPVISCHTCYSCQENKNNACHSLGFVGLSGFGGGLAEYINVNAGPNDAYLHHLPDNVSFKEGAMVEPLSVAMHAVQASKLTKGQTALVVGAGPIGCFVIKTLIAQGASKIIVSEPSSVRRATALKAGAHHVFNPIEVDVPKECQKLTGGEDRGVDVAFECAGVQKALDQVLASIRPRGIAVNVAIWSTKPQIDMNALLLKERTLTGVICYKDNHPTALKSLASGAINLDGFVTSTIKLNDIVKGGFEELIKNNENHVKILCNLTGQDPK